MKYFKIILSVLLICVMLSGCSFRVSSSIDDLISPLSPFGDNANIKSALDAYAKKGYALKTPNYGKHITSYNFFDLDGDKDDEAIAFYEPSDNLGAIYMALIRKNGDEWKVVDNVKGDGKEIHSVDFCDLNGDGKKEIIVCWDVISNSTSHQLIVYRGKKKDGELKLKAVNKSISVNNFIACDLYGNRNSELLLFKLNSSNSSSAKAELYSLSSDKLKLLGETKLDSNVTTYDSLTYQKDDALPKVYADAIMSDGSSMLTEIIYWSDTYNTIMSPFYRYSTGKTKETRRKAMLASSDVNEDSVIDIPKDYKLSKLPSQVNAIDYKNFKKSVLLHSNYALYINKDNYLVLIPDKYIDKISVKYDKKIRLLEVLNKKTKKEIFSIMPVLTATYSSEKYRDYEVVLENSGYSYLAKQGDDKIKITTKDLTKSIKSVN